MWLIELGRRLDAGSTSPFLPLLRARRGTRSLRALEIFYYVLYNNRPDFRFDSTVWYVKPSSSQFRVSVKWLPLEQNSVAFIKMFREHSSPVTRLEDSHRYPTSKRRCVHAWNVFP